MARRVFTDFESEALTEADCQMAGEASRRLDVPLMARPARLEVYEREGGQQQVLDIPTAAIPMLTRLLAEMADGHKVAILAKEDELSTSEAAEILGMSRPYVVGLLDQGIIPSRRVGAHRRVRLQDVLDYKRKDETSRLEALRALTAEAQELDMGY